MMPTPRFPASAVRHLSYCQIVVGVIMFALEATFLGIKMNRRWFDYMTGGGGFICGVFLAVTGVLGLRAAQKPTLCTITANMVLAILSAILSCGIIAPTSLGVDDTKDSYYYYESTYVVLYATQLTLGLLSLLVSFAAAAICCRALCYFCERAYGQDQEGPEGATGGVVPAPDQTKTANAQDYQGYGLPPNYQDVEMCGGGDKQKPRY